MCMLNLSYKLTKQVAKLEALLYIFENISKVEATVSFRKKEDMFPWTFVGSQLGLS